MSELMPTKIDHYSLALVDNLETDIDEVKFSNNLRMARLDLIMEPRAVKLLGEETFRMAKQIATEGPLKEGYRMASYRSSLTNSMVDRAAELSTSIPHINSYWVNFIPL